MVGQSVGVLNPPIPPPPPPPPTTQEENAQRHGAYGLHGYLTRTVEVKTALAPSTPSNHPGENSKKHGTWQLHGSPRTTMGGKTRLSPLALLKPLKKKNSEKHGAYRLHGFKDYKILCREWNTSVRAVVRLPAPSPQKKL